MAKASGSFLVIGSREFQSKKLTFSSVLSGNTKVNSGTKTASGSSQKAHNGKARKAHGQCFSYFSWLLHVLSQSHLTNPNSASEIVFFLSFSYFFLFGFPMCCHNPWLGGGAPYNTVSPVMYDHQLKILVGDNTENGTGEVGTYRSHMTSCALTNECHRFLA